MHSHIFRPCIFSRPAKDVPLTPPVNGKMTLDYTLTQVRTGQREYILKHFVQNMLTFVTEGTGRRNLRTAQIHVGTSLIRVTITVKTNLLTIHREP